MWRESRNDPFPERNSRFLLTHGVSKGCAILNRIVFQYIRSGTRQEYPSGVSGGGVVRVSDLSLASFSLTA
jgi:hypothetical protein